MTAINRRPTLLTFTALLVLVGAGAIYATGGGEIRPFGLRLSATNPTRAVLIAAALLSIEAWRHGRASLSRQVAWVFGWLTPTVLVTVLALFTVFAGLKWGSRVAGGSDSYGYVSQADLWLQGRLLTPLPLADRAPWPDAVSSFTPLGYRPALHGAAMVPMYAAGLPLVMAAAKLAGGDCAPFWISPLCGAILVITTFIIGRRLGSDWIGALAAWLLVTSPVFLCMVFNTMSDVPASAFWAVAIAGVLRGTVPSLAVGGISAAVAILVRPNLAPLALVLLAWALWNERARRSSWPRMLAAFAPAVVVAGAVVAAMNTALYDSPLTSGYVGLIGFSVANIPTNVVNWLSWISTTQTPLLLVGWASLYAFSGTLWQTVDAARTARLLGLVAAAVASAYVTYTPWEEWWFLRFLLPAWPAFCLGTAAGIAAIALRVPGLLRPVVVVGVLALGCWTTGVAVKKEVFLSGEGDQRYPAVAWLVRRFTASNSVIISGQHSGSLRYYAGRLTLRYDRLDPQWLDRAVAWLRDHGVRPYILLDDGERPLFRDRFGAANRLGKLDGVPVAAYLGPGTTFLYDPLSTVTKTVTLGRNDVPVPWCAKPAGVMASVAASR